MRKLVAPLLCSLVIGSALMAAGCQASLTMGTDTPAPTPVPAPAPAPTPAPAPVKAKPTLNLHAIRLIGNKVALPGPVVFETGSDKLSPVSEPVLAVVQQFLTENPNVNLLRIEGHTDTDGKADANLDLSKRRSLSVAHWLTGKGIDCKRLIPVGFGQTKPIADNKTEEGKAQNRRVDFIKASENGKPIADDRGKALPVDGGGESGGDPCK